MSQVLADNRPAGSVAGPQGIEIQPMERPSLSQTGLAKQRPGLLPLQANRVQPVQTGTPGETAIIVVSYDCQRRRFERTEHFHQSLNVAGTAVRAAGEPPTGVDMIDQVATQYNQIALPAGDKIVGLFDKTFQQSMRTNQLLCGLWKMPIDGRADHVPQSGHMQIAGKGQFQAIRGPLEECHRA